MSNVPEIVFGVQGLVVPLETSVLLGVQADINAAFNNQLDFTNDETPQGQLATTFAAITSDKNSQFLWFVNMIDPATAVGKMQDGIARIYFIERQPAQSTIVTCTGIGQPGTFIPAGTRIQDVSGQIYYSSNEATIDGGGVVTISFVCATPGPVVCAPNTLNRFYQTIPGWDAITNSAPGVVGSDVESPQDFEVRRSQSVALNARGSNDAIKGAVLSLPGVLDAFVTDNRTSSTVVVRGVSLAPHSLYVCPVGGDDDAIANAILERCSTGCDFNGTTSVTVFDTSYGPNGPSYLVKFQRPSAVATKIQINILNSDIVPSTALGLIQAVVLNAFAGLDKGPRARIGGTVFASRFYAGIASLGPWAQIIHVLVGTTAATLDSFTVNMDQIPVLASADITVTLI